MSAYFLRGPGGRAYALELEGVRRVVLADAADDGVGGGFTEESAHFLDRFVERIQILDAFAEEAGQGGVLRVRGAFEFPLEFIHGSEELFEPAGRGRRRRRNQLAESPLDLINLGSALVQDFRCPAIRFRSDFEPS